MTVGTFSVSIMKNHMVDFIVFSAYLTAGNYNIIAVDWNRLGNSLTFFLVNSLKVTFLEDNICSINCNINFSTQSVLFVSGD